MLRKKMVEQLRECINDEVKTVVMKIKTCDERNTLPDNKLFRRFLSEYEDLSDHDAYVIIPCLSEVFQNAMDIIENKDFPDEQKYASLLRVSNMRKTMKLDERWREINKGMFI